MHVVKAEDLGKTYKLYDRPSDRLKELLFRRPFHKEFVALNGVSFALEKGGTLGVIGVNGAGKSTLLKILSRTLSPTRGQFEVKGVLSSMLELGSGFHPEFTGIENIFFYGSLIGINNDTMKSKVDEIVDFSELGDFVHYPIKTYSSGMHVRLAFSVATIVDPDILIIDEALSVGDQYFQMKCLEKMEDFKRKRKTIIFCTHDLYQIKTFCKKAIWLDHGQVKLFGESLNVTNAYVRYEQTKVEEYKSELEKETKSSFLFIKDLSVIQKDKNMHIEFIITSKEQFHGHIAWAIVRKDQLQLASFNSHMQQLEPFLFYGKKKVFIEIENINVINGPYFIYVGVLDKQAYKPLAIECIDFTFISEHDTAYTICHFDSSFTVM